MNLSDLDIPSVLADTFLHSPPSPFDPACLSPSYHAYNELAEHPVNVDDLQSASSVKSPAITEATPCHTTTSGITSLPRSPSQCSQCQCKHTNSSGCTGPICTTTSQRVTSYGPGTAPSHGQPFENASGIDAALDGVVSQPSDITTTRSSLEHTTTNKSSSRPWSGQTVPTTTCGSPATCLVSGDSSSSSTETPTTSPTPTETTGQYGKRRKRSKKHKSLEPTTAPSAHSPSTFGTRATERLPPTSRSQPTTASICRDWNQKLTDSSSATKCKAIASSICPDSPMDSVHKQGSVSQDAHVTTFTTGSVNTTSVTGHTNETGSNHTSGSTGNRSNSQERRETSRLKNSSVNDCKAEESDLQLDTVASPLIMAHLFSSHHFQDSLSTFIAQYFSEYGQVFVNNVNTQHE